MLHNLLCAKVCCFDLPPLIPVSETATFLSAHLTMEAYQSKHSAAQTSSHLERRYKGEGVVMDWNNAAAVRPGQAVQELVRHEMCAQGLSNHKSTVRGLSTNSAKNVTAL